MRVVLRDDVENVGRKGDLVEVADGYARNYLVPRGLALQATKGAVQQAEAMRRSREQRETREREEAQAVADRLGGTRIEIAARAGEGGRLFGSVTASDIADAVQAQVGVEVDRHRLGLGEPLKELGEAEVTLRLHTDVDVTLTVDVVAAS
jgi:large subunit ribosomal protein L9